MTLLRICPTVLKVTSHVLGKLAVVRMGTLQPSTGVSSPIVIVMSQKIMWCLGPMNPQRQVSFCKS